MPASPCRVAFVFFLAACSGKPSSDTAGGTPTDTAAKVASTTDTTAAPGTANIRDTRWNLVALGDKPLAPADTQRATPHIILAPDSKQVSGSGGCNRMFGVYELNGEKLRFSGVGSTKMACAAGMDTESQFLGSLLRVRGWKITGQQLELSDSTGAVLARFEAKK
jgi:putative lipoprotein